MAEDHVETLMSAIDKLIMERCPERKDLKYEKSLNDIVADCRYNLKMTYDQVSAQTGYSKPYLCQIEAGQRKVPEALWIYWYNKGAIERFSDFDKYENRCEPPIRKKKGE